MTAAIPAPDGARQRLLRRAVGYAEEHGLSDRSLRQIAEGIGSSHRMLIYHFGSKDGLRLAIVAAVEADQRLFLRRLLADPALDPPAAIRAMWRHLADESLWPHERLFFELYGQALQGRPGTGAFLEGIVDTWVEVPADDAGHRTGDPATVAADARLGVAVMRGLLLDLLATGDRRRVDEALDRFADLYAAAPRPPAPADRVDGPRRRVPRPPR